MATQDHVALAGARTQSAGRALLLVAPAPVSFLRHYLRHFAAALPAGVRAHVLTGAELAGDGRASSAATRGPVAAAPSPCAEARLYGEAARRAIDAGAAGLHACFLADPGALAPAARDCARAGVRVSASLFGLAELRDEPRRRALLALLGMDGVRRVLVHSNHPGHARRVAAEAGLPLGDRLAFVHDPIYDDRAPYERDRAAARRDLGLPSGEHIVLCVGALSRRKGADVLLDACRRLAGHSGLRILIAGADGDAPPEVRAGLRALPNVIRRERFLDDDEMASCFAAADVVALPYTAAYRDGTSGVLVQAALAGRPVVVPAIAPFCDVVAHHRVGRTFACDDAADLALVLAGTAASPCRAPGWADYLDGIESWPRLAELAVGARAGRPAREAG